MKFSHRLLFAMACLLPLAVSAQWRWIDPHGRTVFSDLPPPPGTPERNILRRDSRVASTAGLQPVQAAVEPAPPERPAARPASSGTATSKDAGSAARQAEEAEKARQAAETRKVAQAKADNCTRARQGKAALDSGLRIARLNAQGEREVMDEQARTEEGRRLQAVIQSDCL